jgi:hypothetical protein
VSQDDWQDPQRQGQRHEGKHDPCTVPSEAPEHEGLEIGKQREEAVGQPASRGTEADRQRAPSLVFGARHSSICADRAEVSAICVHADAATVRMPVSGVWLVHAASDAWVDKLGEPLTVQSAKRANEGPMLADMLKELNAAPDCQSRSLRN